MAIALTVVLAMVAAIWLLMAAGLFAAMRRLPHLPKIPPLPDGECPRVSVIFSARDEAAKISSAVESMLALDYPNFEVVAVNDRSQDATPQILDELARRHPHLQVIHVRELPPGWLGKTHGLQCGYEASCGEWLLFTDADVRFAPDTLRRAMRAVRESACDHFTLLSRMEMEGFWETAMMSCFCMLGVMLVRPLRISNPNSRAFAGAGYFNLVRRGAYEAAGTHQKLALEVVDDMKLGKMIKRAGFRSGIAFGDDMATLRWQHGVGNIIRGLEKNGFAGIGFSVPLFVLAMIAAPIVHVLPYVALIAASGWMQIFAAIAALTAVCSLARTALYLKKSPLYGLTHPLGATLMTYALAHSAVKTLRRGGIVWRDTFHSLDELRKGMV